ncbi:SDR family oxidoreductase [Burkholderia plantarii]|uniref:SDR family oxidoreductase n=1 Tax=Burkholderia plantarii TaxID=41899 RepID=UPI0018DB9115|nr:SDR family oxidoreductase [Burkholderia plantarii]MBI0331538.1 SDR family oxidoreductase [Burkholderia plantarii]
MSRTWFITGIGSGFGREMAGQLLARGERVAGTLRDAAAVAPLRERYGARLWTATLDLTDTHGIARVVAQAFDAFGRLDVIVNNAGYGLFGVTEGLDDAQVRHQLDTNLVAPIQVTRAALPRLRAQGGGRILAISSYGGQATHAGAALYHASKWGMEGFFDALAAEVAPFGIGVTIVEPGGARTGFRRAAGVHFGAEVAAYRDTPVGALRARLSDPGFVARGDPAKMVELMIASVDETPAPKRIVLGRDAYTMIRNALGERLAAVEAGRELAFSTDLPEGR